MRRIRTALIASAVLLLLLVVVTEVFGAWRLYAITSGSMVPTLSVGSDVIALRESPSQVSRGQVLVFTAPEKPPLTVSHRVIWVKQVDGVTYIRTQGDANSVADPWGTIHLNSTAWRVVYVVPLLGYVTLFIGHYLPLLICLLVVVIGLSVALPIVWKRERAPAKPI
jgi:signal peptidase I